MYVTLLGTPASLRPSVKMKEPRLDDLQNLIQFDFL